MTGSILICIGAFAALLALLRDGKPTLGLPIAYFYGLLLIHVPGAFMHALPGADLPGREYVATGIGLTAVGSVAFVMGVWLARRKKSLYQQTTNLERPGQPFWLFCLIVGWLVGYVLLPLLPLASVSAVLNALSGVWTLGVLLGLRNAVQARRAAAVAAWSGALLVNPLLTLVLSGFLSYGATAVTICLAGLVVLFRRGWTLGVALVALTYVALSLFVSYFSVREDIRYVAWSAAGMEARIEASAQIIEAAAWFDARDPDHASYLDQRLNQNYFVGLSAARLADGDVAWFDGRSFVEGIIAFVPRLIWPEKPLIAGSGTLVSDLTGLNLSQDSSFGIGNVLEFYANFGWRSLIVGFLGFGWIFGRLDLSAAVAERTGRYRVLFSRYLVAIALIQPNGSIVELATGSAAAWFAALGCGWLWSEWELRRGRGTPVPHPASYASPPYPRTHS